MIVRRDDFVKALELLNMIPARPGVPQSEYIMMRAGEYSLYMYLSSDALGRVKVPMDSGDWPMKEDSYYIDRSVLIPFVLAAKNMPHGIDKFEFVSEGTNQLGIKHGRRHLKLSPLPVVTGYGKVAIDKDANELTFTAEQREIIQCAQSCATSDPITPHLSCVYVSDIGLVMSSNAITMFAGKIKKMAQATPLPLFLLKLLGLDGIQKVLFTDKKVMLKFDHGEVVQTVPHQAIKAFPSSKILTRIKEVKAYPEVLEMSSEKLSKVLDRFGTYMTSIRKQDRNLLFEIKKGKDVIGITTNISQVKFSETVKLPAEAKKDMSIEWELDVVAPVLKFLASNKKPFTLSCDVKTPYHLESDEINLIIARKVK